MTLLSLSLLSPMQPLLRHQGAEIICWRMYIATALQTTMLFQSAWYTMVQCYEQFTFPFGMYDSELMPRQALCNGKLAVTCCCPDGLPPFLRFAEFRMYPLQTNREAARHRDGRRDSPGNL